MRTLRFSAGLTVLLMTLLPGVVGLLLGAAFFVYHLVSHIGGDLNVLQAAKIWLLTAMHGLFMYAIPALLIGIALIFFLDRGIFAKRFLWISLFIALIMLLWAKFTVGFEGSLYSIFLLSFIPMYGFLYWVSVPMEKRTTARLFV